MFIDNKIKSFIFLFQFVIELSKFWMKISYFAKNLQVEYSSLRVRTFLKQEYSQATWTFIVYIFDDIDGHRD